MLLMAGPHVKETVRRRLLGNFRFGAHNVMYSAKGNSESVIAGPSSRLIAEWPYGCERSLGNKLAETLEPQPCGLRGILGRLVARHPASRSPVS